MRVHGLTGTQNQQYNGMRGRCIKYFGTGKNAGMYKVRLVGDDDEPLMRDDGKPNFIALWPRNIELTVPSSPSEGAASAGSDVYGEDELQEAGVRDDAVEAEAAAAAEAEAAEAEAAAAAAEAEAKAAVAEAEAAVAAAVAARSAGKAVALVGGGASGVAPLPSTPPLPRASG